MSVWDKLTFWKKKDDLGADLGLPPLPGEPGADLGLPELEPRDSGYGTYPQPRQPDIRPPPLTPITPMQHQSYGPSAPQPYGYPQDTMSKDVEIVSAKLDSIRATLESINQRLANIERIAYRDEERVQVRRQW